MLARISRFLKNCAISLGRCIIDEALPDIGGLSEGTDGLLTLLLMMAVCVSILSVVYGFFQVGYELMFDPNATDVSARLASISITPEKLM
jgi:hypothetical protein